MSILGRLLLQAFLAIGLVVFFSANIYSQTSGTLDGTVVDENNMPVEGALVMVTNQDDGVPYAARSNAQGKYVFPFLEPGRYTISIEKMGYEKTEKINFIIPLNKTTVTLPPIVIRSLGSQPTNPNTNPNTSTTTQPVASSSGNDVLVDLTDGTNRGNYDSSLLTSLPLGGIRTFDFFALLSPGVLPSPATTGAAGPGLGPGVGTSGQFSVNGRRARANNFTIDGSDNNDQDIGVRRQGFVSLVPQSIESVNEFQISTQVWDAEFGRNIGSQVNAVSRSGGNDIHGTLYGFYNTDGLNARNFFDLTGGASQDKDKNRRAQLGFVLGGPIIKNQTHYFLSFERQDLRATQENHFAVPSGNERIFLGNGGFSTKVGLALSSILPLPNNPAGPYGANNFTQVLPADARGTVFSVKINQKIGKSVFTARYNFTDDRSIIPSVGNAINSSIGSNTRTQNLSLFFNTQISPSLSNQARVSYGRTTLAFPVEAGSPLLFGETPATLNLQKLANDLNKAGNVRLESYLGSITAPFGTFSPFGRTGALGKLSITPFSPVGVDTFTFPQGRTNNTYQLADTLVKTFGGHTVKFGADFRRTQLNSFLDRNFRPEVVFTSGLFANPSTTPRLILGSDLALAGIPSQLFQTIATNPDSNIGLRFNEYNFFAQDTWRVNRRLSINYGLRYEYTSVPVEVNNKIEQTFNIKFPASNPNIGKTPFGQQFQGLFEGFIDDATASLNKFLDGRDKIFRPDRNNFSPRIGLAFDPFGKSTTSIRLGYGIYYDQIIGSVTSQSRNVFPNFIPVVFDPKFAFDPFGNVILTLGSFGDTNLASIGRLINFIQPGSLNTLGFGGDVLKFGLGEALIATGARNPDFNGGPRGGGIAFVLPDANLRTPYSQHWNVSVEHQFGKDFVATASYVGSTGTKLIRFRTPNGGSNSFSTITPNSALPTGFEAGAKSPTRKDPNLGPFVVIESSAASIYHSLQLSVSKRFTNGLQFGSSYTYSHTIDEVSDVFDTAGSFTLPQDDNNLRAERASASFDVRHRSISYFNYDLPFFSKNQFLGGFQLNGVVTLQTGQPFTVNQGVDTNRDGNLTDRLDTSTVIKQVDNGIHRLNDPNSSFRKDLESITDSVRTGTVGRNTFRAPGVASVDLAVVKKLKISDRQQIFVRTEFFNLFNRTHFGIPVRVFGSPAFGNSVNTSLPARIIQFAVKYQF